MKLRVISIETCAELKRRPRAAYTLIELIGGFGIIAVLMAALSALVVQILQRSKVNNTVGSYLSLRQATVNHVTQYQAFNSLFGTTPEAVPITNYCSTILIPEGFLNNSFQPRCGGPNAVVQLVTGPASNNRQGYWFEGLTNGTAYACTTNCVYVVECVLTNVSFSDVTLISSYLDQGHLVPALDGYLDTAGKLDYSATNGGTLRMYVIGR